MCSDFRKPGDIFVRYLASRIREFGTGSGADGEIIYPDRPRDRLFIGRLAPSGLPDDDLLENAEDFYSRLDPPSVQMCFLLKYAPETKLTIRPSFHLYGRIFPDFNKQNAFSRPKFNAGQRESELIPVFRRVKPKITEIVLKVGDLSEPYLQVPVEWDRKAVEKMPRLYRGLEKHKFGKEHLSTSEAFEQFLESIAGTPAMPDIRLFIMASATEWEKDICEISLIMVNRSLDSDPLGKDRIFDEVIFNAGFEVEVINGSIEPYVFPALPKSYRFDRNMYGMGVNCTVSAYASDGNDFRYLRTQSVPTYEQHRFDHRELSGVSTSFTDMEGDRARKQLDSIAHEMRLFDEVEWGRKEQELAATLPEGKQEYHEFLADREAFRKEIETFEKGIRCLDLRQAAKAFSLMNSTFRLLGEGRQDRWRLFQIVFIVSMLPTIVGREYPDYADQEEWEITDVIWFPTGGGKTEAYLGLTVFGLFFDRIRGRDCGVTALYRFPLRLLSLQQFQRIVRAVAAANRIRKEYNIPGDPFTVGHWIGSQGSPNEVSADEAKVLEEDAETPAEGGVSVLTKKYRKIGECPNPGCGSRGIFLRFDRSLWSLQHVCPKCGVLPIYIVDHELYRHLPSIVVGTVDKLAVFGLQRRFVNLLGWTGGYCPEHGFASEKECLVVGCKRKNLQTRTIKDPVPALHIQDELHLLKEDLGAFDSHYETSIIGIQREVPGFRKPWKTIAATATIEDFERHIEHLYLRRGRRFPTPGPSYENTFFARTDQENLSRLFIGINPSGLTHINAMVALLWYFHREISTLRKLQPEEFLKTTGTKGLLQPKEMSDFLDQYEISLTYVLTKKAGDQMAESLDAQVGGYLKEQNLPDLVSVVLTGGTTSDKITEIMDRIEELDLKEPEYWKHIRSVVATSMISHGVDVERFNFIPFFGMPRMVSEYIQASSRVGRNLPGIVLVCFAPARERDRSHYHFFGKFHEYLERLVEPAAINRWSKFSIQKTINGIIIGHVINSTARRLGEKLTTEKKIRLKVPRELNIAGLTQKICSYYGADAQASGEFAEYIADRAAHFINGLRANANTYIGRRRGWKPMRSLRDTDQEVIFYPSRNSSILFELLLRDRIRPGETEEAANVE
jgi:hypothetical protein